MKLFLFFITITFSSLLANAQNNWAYDTVKIGGIGQVIATKGVKNGPLILFLHGGPGSSRMKQADAFSNDLQRYFTVVQWDQRESGRTLSLNKTNTPISLDLMARDTYELIDTLLKKFHQQKLYLAGESWGTVLGFKMAEAHPEKLYAYLSFSSVIAQGQSEQLLLTRLVKDAQAKGNTIAEKELAQVKIPFENVEQLYYLRKWWFNYEGHPFSDKDTAAVKEFFQSWADTWFSTWNEVMEHNLLVELPVIKCPVYFFIGGKDYQTNCEITKSYYNKLSAPKKKMYWFENASHDVLISDAAKIQRIIIDEILE